MTESTPLLPTIPRTWPEPTGRPARPTAEIPGGNPGPVGRREHLAVPPEPRPPYGGPRPERPGVPLQDPDGTLTRAAAQELPAATRDRPLPWSETVDHRPDRTTRVLLVICLVAGALPLLTVGAILLL